MEGARGCDSPAVKGLSGSSDSPNGLVITYGTFGGGELKGEKEEEIVVEGRSLECDGGGGK
jgi:hypothetical protein